MHFLSTAFLSPWLRESKHRDYEKPPHLGVSQDAPCSSHVDGLSTPELTAVCSAGRRRGSCTLWPPGLSGGGGGSPQHLGGGQSGSKERCCFQTQARSSRAPAGLSSQSPGRFGKAPSHGDLHSSSCDLCALSSGLSECISSSSAGTRGITPCLGRQEAVVTSAGAGEPGYRRRLSHAGGARGPPIPAHSSEALLRLSLRRISPPSAQPAALHTRLLRSPLRTD